MTTARQTGTKVVSKGGGKASRNGARAVVKTGAGATTSKKTKPKTGLESGPTEDARVDAYIERAQPFARPLLEHLRALVHRAYPECVEKIKWGFPHFDYRGEMMCAMAAFQEHISFGFWKKPLLDDPQGRMAQEEGMGSFGKIRTRQDLPPDAELAGFIRQAMRLNEEGVKVQKPKVARAPLPVPAELAAALEKDAMANQRFTAFSASMQREYIEWVNEAKTESTREKRIATTVEWVAEGKGRNWKYEKKPS